MLAYCPTCGRQIVYDNEKYKNKEADTCKYCKCIFLITLKGSQ